MTEIWNTALLSGLMAALFSVIISALLNLYAIRYKSKRQDESGFVNARAQLYSYLFFWLKTWLYSDIDVPLSWEDFNAVDTRLSEKLHLINPNIQKEWLELHGRVTERNYPKAVNTAKKLVELIRKDFNDNIIPKYEKYVGKNIQKLTN